MSSQGEPSGQGVTGRKHPCLAGLTVVALLLACSSESTPPVGSDAGIRPRVFNPPPSKVRAVPPHNVHGQGIGPYELGAPLKKILGTLPHGPRIELFRLGPLADFSLARSENGALLIGMEREVGVTFVAAVAEKIARTESGAGVGSPASVLESELGPPIDEPTVARDPRLARYRDLPGTVFVRSLAEPRRVEAIVVDSAATIPSKASPPKPEPDAPILEAKNCSMSERLIKQARTVGRIAEPSRVAVVCADRKPEGAVVHDRRRLSWVSIEKGKMRRGGSVALEGLSFAAPITVGQAPDDQVHVVAVQVARTLGEIRLNLKLFRIDGARLVQVVDNRVYSLSKDEISWVGGTLEGVEIALEITAVSATDLRASGLYVERSGGRVVMVAPLADQTIKIKKRPAAASSKKETIDAGAARDAGPADAKKNKAPAKKDARSKPASRPARPARPR